MNIFCDKSRPDAFEFSGPSPDCGVQITISTSKACPVFTGGAGGESTPTPGRKLPAGWIAFIAIVIMVTCYCLVGIAYNRLKFGARGIEAVPHIALWRALYARLSCCGSRGSSPYSLTSDDGGEYIQDEHAAKFSFADK